MSVAKLRPLELDDIQLLRYWRNLDHVRSKMVFTQLIGRDDQRKWFEEINLETTQYFIYSLDSRDIGSVHLTKINFNDKTFEGGIFCGDTSFLVHWINIWAYMMMHNHAFNSLGLDTSYVTILKSNKSALSLNQFLGYIYSSDQDDNVSRFILTKDRYIKASEKLQKYFEKHKYYTNNRLGEE